jgi:superfamily II DNA or RNA helicase
MIDFSNIGRWDDQLHDYQNENKFKIYKEWYNGRRVMLQMPTGTGKTRLFVSIVKDLQYWSIANKRAVKTLIIAHRQELIDQISNNVGHRYKIAHGIIMANYDEKPRLTTQIASIQTLNRRLDNWCHKDFNIIIIDEAHHTTAATYKKIIDTFKNATILGVTATPYRMNGEGFLQVYDKLITSLPVSDFIKDGYLSNYEYYSIKPDSEIHKMINEIDEFSFDGDYSETALAKIFNKPKIRAKIFDAYFQYAKGKKGIIYTIDKAHNMSVCKTFREKGIKAENIDSTTKKEKREEIIRNFKNGKIDIICNVNIFSEGFDCPDVEFIQLARPTKSLSMYLQQVGRGFRVHENKEKLIILDNVGLYNRFGLPSAKRKWEYHFKGHQDSEITEETMDDSFENLHFIDESKVIEEGSEAVDLLYNSLQDKFDEIAEFPILTINNSEINSNPFRLGDSFTLIYQSFVNNLEEDDGLDSLNWWALNAKTNFKKVLKGTQWGIFDKGTHKIVIDPIYDEIDYPNIFQKAKVNKNDKCGIIDCSNWDLSVPLNYSSLENIPDTEYFVAEKRGVFGVIDSKNSILLPFEFDEIFYVNNQITFHLNALKNKYWEVYKDNFLKLTDFKISAKPIIGELYTLTYNGVFGFFSSKGTLVSPCWFKNIVISDIKKAPFFAQIDGGFWGPLDSDLNWVFNPIFLELSKFNEKLIKATFLTGTGLINEDGSIVVPFEYSKNDISVFLDYFIVRKNNVWIILDKNGTSMGIESTNRKEAIKCLKMKLVISPIKEKKERKDVKDPNGIELNTTKKQTNLKPENVKPKYSKENNTLTENNKLFEQLLKYKERIWLIKNNNSKQKIIMLLSIINLIGANKIHSSKFIVDKIIFNEFKYNYQERIGNSSHFEHEFIRSLIQLHEDGFIHLVTFSQSYSIKRDMRTMPNSISELNKIVKFIELNESDFSLFNNPKANSILKKVLLS